MEKPGYTYTRWFSRSRQLSSCFTIWLVTVIRHRKTYIKSITCSECGRDTRNTDKPSCPNCEISPFTVIRKPRRSLIIALPVSIIYFAVLGIAILLILALLFTMAGIKGNGHIILILASAISLFFSATLFMAMCWKYKRGNIQQACKV